MEKVDNMQEHMSNCKQRGGNTKKPPKGNAWNQKHRMKNVFDGLINRLDKTEERTSDLENLSTETPEAEGQRIKEWQKEQNAPPIWDSYKRC